MTINRQNLTERSRKTKGKFLPLVFIGPHLIIFLIFTLIPVFFGIYVSFTKWDLIAEPVWVGLDNYKEIIMNQESTFHRQFIDGLKNTLTFVAFDVPFSVAVPLIFAVLLNVKPKGHRVFQAVLYIPTLLSITAVGIIWNQMLNKNYGIPSWFDVKTVLTSKSPYMWIFLIIFSVWWTMGRTLVIYLAALGGVDKDLYESAALDGANGWHKFWYITLPSIRFPLTYNLITIMAGSLNVYGQPLVLTGGKVKVMVTYIRELAFGSGQPIAGMGSAMAMVLGLFVMIVSVVQFVLLSKED